MMSIGEWWGWTEEDWQNSPAEFLHSGGDFFLVLRSSKSNGSQQQVFVRKELGATFPSHYDFDLSK